MAELDDSALIGQYADYQTEAAFAELVRRYLNLVYSVAFRSVGNAQDAQDVAQAVFVILARKAPELRRRDSLTGWLYETTRLTSRQLLRTRARQQGRDLEAYMQSTLEPSSDDSLWPQLAPHLEEAMSRLSAADRELLALRFYENKSGAETATLLGIGPYVVYKRTTRALAKLQKFLGRRGITSTTAVLAGTISANSVQAAPAGLAHAISAVAVTKSVVASASTLTLIKGALKIMAWSKMKTAAVTGAIVVFAAITAVSVETHLHHRNELRLPIGQITPMVGYGYSRYVVILASDGSLWSWGEETLGWPVLGLKNTNIQNSVSLRRIGDQNDWRSVAVGDSQCLAIKSDGTLWGWGANYDSQLGDGTKIKRQTPVQSISGNDWKQATCNSGASFALKQDGTLWAWGNNSVGQLGTGDTISRTNAVQIGDSTHWKKVETGSIQTVGLQTDGTLWFWGVLSGSGRDQNKLLVPTRVSPDTDWADACFGYFTVLALKTDGTLWSFGRDAHSYAEVGDTNVIITPKQVGTENDWQSISSTPGCYYHLLRKRDGSLWALDASEHRIIKPASEYKPIPVRQIDFKKGIAAYCAGWDNIGVVLTPDGEVWTWGNVIGGHSRNDFWGPNKKRLFPEYKVVEKPWQVSIADASN